MNQKIPLALSFDDVLLVPQYSEIDSRSEVDISSSLSPNVKIKIPLISTKMDTVTGVEMAIALGKLGSFGILPRFESPRSQAEKVAKVKRAKVITAAAIGVKNGFLERAEMLVTAGATIIDIDVAHGHLKKTLEATSLLKNHFGEKILLISGIVATYEAAVDLYKAGADCLLVGVGGGATCTTRVQTGFGLPVFTSLLEVAKASKKFKKTFMPDSGVRNAGDIVKSLATGASGVVSGFLFAGCDEAPGEIIKIGNEKYKRYNGSASEAEKLIHTKKIKGELNGNYTVQIEGVESLVPYKGPVKEVINKLLAGIRSGLSYGGAKNIPELWKKGKFAQITPGGARESTAHDVIVK